MRISRAIRSGRMRGELVFLFSFDPRQAVEQRRRPHRSPSMPRSTRRSLCWSIRRWLLRTAGMSIRGPMEPGGCGARPASAFPVAFDDTAYQLSAQIGAVNYIRLQGHSTEAGPGFLLDPSHNELGRLLTQRPTLASVEDRGERRGASPRKCGFSSATPNWMAKRRPLVLRDYIHKNLALDTFFDAIDIAAGFSFENEINAGIDTAAFAVVHTDAYASRVWCQHEVIRAKRHGRPVVVIHAIEEGEARSFPYIGNVPTIRWRAEEPARVEAVVRSRAARGASHGIFPTTLR